MTKPHLAAAPNMEDILASIRKMISEDRMGTRPLPDQMMRTPFGERPAAETPAPRPANRDPQPETPAGPLERPAPSFSSLSDALKTATTSERRTLDEKIADMLDKGAAQSDQGSTPLAVFSSNKTSATMPMRPEPGRATGPALTSRRATASPPDREGPPKTLGPMRAREAPAKEAAPSRESKEPRDSGAPKPSANETRATQQESRLRPLPTSRADPRIVRDGIAEPNADSERIITMPARFPTAQGAEAAPNNPALNGAKVSQLGPWSFPGGLENTAPSSEPGEADTAKAEPAKAEVHATLARDEESKEPAVPHDEKIAAEEESSPAVVAAEPGDAVAATETVTAGETKSMGMPPLKQEGEEPAKGAKPSEALLDAVVKLVHEEPSALSVFTSGSAFIHGIGSEGMAADKPAVPRKLDRAAAELLRPMLRQWLADNMPRIVEEALRSELMSSQSAEEDSDKA